MLTVAQLTNYRTCMACEDTFHCDDGKDLVVGFVCAGCVDELTVPLVDLVAVFRDLACGRKMTFSTVTLDEFCGVDCADDDEDDGCTDCGGCFDEGIREYCKHRVN